MVAASELLVSEQSPLPAVTNFGIAGLAGNLLPGFMPVTGKALLPVVHNLEVPGPGGYAIPRLMLICGLLLWLIPAARTYNSLLAISLALGSWVTSNLGGFFIGMFIGVIGGALAFAWTTDADYESARRRGKPRMGLPVRALDVVSRLTSARRSRGAMRAPTRPTSPALPDRPRHLPLALSAGSRPVARQGALIAFRLSESGRLEVDRRPESVSMPDSSAQQPASQSSPETPATS